MTGWIIRCRGIDWECRTEQDALGVLVYLRDYGRQPFGAITVEPAPTQTMAGLLAEIPTPAQQALL